MAKIYLTSVFVQDPPRCPSDKGKVDYYDTQLPGFLLEVRSSGRATYYQRYRDKYGRIKQARIGHTNSLSLEDMGTGIYCIFCLWENSCSFFAVLRTLRTSH